MGKSGQLGSAKPNCPDNQGPLKPPKKAGPMILFVAIDLKQVRVLGRKFCWSKPQLCPCCRQSHLWGHGFADTYFEGFTDALPMRRFFCPACRCVIKCRPKGYFSRIQTAISTIKSHLAGRIDTGRWPPSCRGSRGRHWLAALKAKVLVYLGLDWMQRLIQGFDRLCRLGLVPVSVSF